MWNRNAEVWRALASQLCGSGLTPYHNDRIDTWGICSILGVQEGAFK